jgi:hypothetical protein
MRSRGLRLAKVRLQCPNKHLSTDRGERVGGVSERPTQEGTRSDPGDRLRFAAVKGTLIVGMPSSFAGRRWNAGLGRLVYARNGSLPFERARR